MKITPTVAAANALLLVARCDKGGTLCLVGDPGTFVVPLQQPAVAEPDVDTDADWMDCVYKTETQQLDADNTLLPVPYRGLFRIKKPASSGYSFGVRYY